VISFWHRVVLSVGNSTPEKKCFLQYGDEAVSRFRGAVSPPSMLLPYITWWFDHLIRFIPKMEAVYCSKRLYSVIRLHGVST